MSVTRIQIVSAVLLTSAIALAASQGAAPLVGKTLATSEHGHLLTVVSETGLGTTNAVIRAKFTREDAIQDCKDNDPNGNVTEKCIHDTLAAPSPPFKTEITANCMAGTFTNFYGDKLEFKGLNKAGLPKGSDAPAKYILLDLRTRQALEMMGASGYVEDMAMYRALCPSRAPKDE